MKRKPKVETFRMRNLSGERDFTITQEMEEERVCQLEDLGDYARERRIERSDHHRTS